jgi:uncharacterized membrane protein
MSKILFGIVIPAAVFAFSFFMTYLMYRHFSKKSE